MTRQLTITRPDDWHLHVRDGEVLDSVVPATAACFGRAIIMPNLVPPVTDTAAAVAYRDRILAAAGDTGFEPLMTLYLTEGTTPETIREAKKAGIVAAKLYPAGATHQLSLRRNRYSQYLSGAGSHGRVRHVAAGARRSDRRRH